MTSRHIGLALLIGAALSTAPARANLITNGSFEEHAAPLGTSTTLAAGSTTLLGWDVLGSDVLVLHTTYGEAGNGVDPFNAQHLEYSVDITGAGNTGFDNGVSQLVATTAGQAYSLSFFVGRAQSSNGSPHYQTPATVDLSIDGGSRISFTNSDVTVGRLNWNQFTHTFTAASANTQITFLNGTPLETSEAGLDDVVLTAVPEPSTGLLCSLALGVVVVAYRRIRS